MPVLITERTLVRNDKQIIHPTKVETPIQQPARSAADFDGCKKLCWGLVVVVLVHRTKSPYQINKNNQSGHLNLTHL